MRRTDLLAVLMVVLGTIGGVCSGYIAGRQSHQNVNDLISVGFTVTDPEGFPVRDFDESSLFSSPFNR
jgi:hypothetical protein